MEEAYDNLRISQCATAKQSSTTIVSAMLFFYFRRLMNTKGTVKKPISLDLILSSNFMMAREITNLLQSEYSKSGIVDFNFQCAVYDQGGLNCFFFK